MYLNRDWALVIPMANEEKDFDVFVTALKKVFDVLKSGKAYLVVDNVSKDHTLELCQRLANGDMRFETVWAPENKNVVDAYIRGYRQAYNNKHEFIIEMDAGMSHDPEVIPVFLRALTEGNECVFGSRFMKGGSMGDSTLIRKFISKNGTIISNLFLGTKLNDMTSGYQGFHANIVGEFLNYKLLSKAHFYQTELRYLLRKKTFAEVPIHYQAPSPSISRRAIYNSLSVLKYYFFKRLFFNPVTL